jgi:hypothetical protein
VSPVLSLSARSDECREAKSYRRSSPSAHFKQPAPSAPPAIDFPKFDGDAPFKTDFPRYLNFLADKKASWLPPPDGPIYIAMRLYWPKETPPSILPPGDGTWKPPAVEVAP